MNRKIFEISPRKATLKPNELCDIELTYSPGNEDEFFEKKVEKIREKHFL